MESLAHNFSRYFKVRLATDQQERHYTFAIRYQVYAEELGWEPLNDHRLEIDPCDEYAYHCLLEHASSGNIAGCVRLVIPTLSTVKAPLPCQTHQIPIPSSHRKRLIDKGRVGEISRLAVPANFRRRARETHQPFVLDERNSTTIYTDEERRNFPNISIGLYLAAIAMVEICDLDRVLVVMEPRLRRHLGRYGLKFHQIGKPFELRGNRALFALPRRELTIHMNEGILELYRLIQQELWDGWPHPGRPWSEGLESHGHV